MAQVRSGRKAYSPFFSSLPASPPPVLMIFLVLRQARASHRLQRLMPTSGSTNSRNSVKACHTSCRLRYSNDTSRLTWLVGGARRMRSTRSRSVRYLPCSRNARNDAKAAAACAVDSADVHRDSRRTVGLGPSNPPSCSSSQPSHLVQRYRPTTVTSPYSDFCHLVGGASTGPSRRASVYLRFCSAAPYVASWSHTVSLNSTARRTSEISASQSWRTGLLVPAVPAAAAAGARPPTYLSASPTWPRSSSTSSSSSSSASTCPTRNAGRVPSRPEMASQNDSVDAPIRRRSGDCVAAIRARSCEADCRAATRAAVSASRACRRAARRCWAWAKELLLLLLETTLAVALAPAGAEAVAAVAAPLLPLLLGLGSLIAPACRVRRPAMLLVKDGRASSPEVALRVGIASV